MDSYRPQYFYRHQCGYHSFYNDLSETETLLAIKIWNLHNLAYILLSIFLAKGFYHTRYNQPTKLTVITTDKTGIV